MDNNLIIPLIFALAGIGVLIFYFYLNQKRTRLLTTGIPVEGIVFDFVQSTRSDSTSSSNYPVIRFVTLEQEWITQAYKISYPTFVLKRGQKVPVFYNPDKPAEFVLNLKIDKWLLLLLAFIGFASLIFAISSFIYTSKK